MQLKLIIRHFRHDIMKLKVPRMFINIYRLKKRFPQMKIYTYKALVQSIKKRNDVCHVVATGQSALDSCKVGIVQPGDYIIGLNFAAFLPYTFDFYFFEHTFGTSDTQIANTKALTELLHKRKAHLPNLVFKNACRAFPDKMVKLIPDIKFSVVFDRIIYYPCVKKLFARPSVVMPQYGSSSITAIMLAYHAGFKNIVVHGLDFSGPHIYHDHELQEQTGVDAPKPYVAKDVKHLTADGQESIFPEMMKMFAKREVNIFCASPNSNFKKYAKIWQQST